MSPTRFNSILSFHEDFKAAVLNYQSVALQMYVVCVCVIVCMYCSVVLFFFSILYSVVSQSCKY